MRTSSKKCTWCGKNDACTLTRDAGNVQHYWHKRCFHAHLAWLRGHEPPERLGPAWDDIRGPIKYRNIRRIWR